MPAPKPDAATLAATLLGVRRRLAEGGLDDPALEARLIVEHFAGIDRHVAMTSPDRTLTTEQLSRIDNAVARRLAGEPVHRIFGWRGFYGLRLKLSPDTLEPRPDTETLVDAVLPFLKEVAARQASCRVLDLGTGSGAIGLAIASQVPEALVTATDVSPGALATATKNAAGNGLAERFIPLLSDWFSAVRDKFHAIVSNPPYIPADAIDGLQREVRLHDPLRALDGGIDGLDAYRAIAAGAGNHLEAGGLVAVEIGQGQRRRVTRIFAEAGYGPGPVHRDLAGTERVLLFCR